MLERFGLALGKDLVGIPAIILMSRLEQDVRAGRIITSLSVAEIEALKTATDAWQITTSLVPGVAGVAALLDLVDAIGHGKPALRRYISDIFVATDFWWGWRRSC